MEKTHTCPYQGSFFLVTRFRRIIQKPERILGPYLGEGMTAIDLGCGPGYFTLPMARMVGAGGKVIAVDLQEEMLAIMGKRAAKRGLAERIRPCLAGKNDINVGEQADFALAMWMVHEVPDRPGFMDQVAKCIKPGGRFMIAEPRIHVSGKQFKKTIDLAGAAGFSLVSEPRVGWSRAAVLERTGG